jgi:drug/metabolite transporter (DMT)-like permease
VSLAAAALWIIALLLQRKLPRDREVIVRLLIQGCAACVIPYTLIAFGQQSVDSALAAILNSTTPLFVFLLCMLWTRHEKVTFGRLFGMIVGLGGVVAIAGVSALAGIGREIAGQAAIVLATVSSAASVIHGRHFARVDPEVAAAGMLTSAAIVLVPLCLIIEQPWRSAPSAASAAALAANAVIVTALGFTIYFRLIRTIGSIATASSSFLKPAVGVLIGCMLMGESLTWTIGLGLVAVLIGVAAINDGAPLLVRKGFARPWRAAPATQSERRRLQEEFLAPPSQAP